MHVFEETACLATVERLTQEEAGGGDFGVLWNHLNSVGRDYAEKYAEGSESLDKVQDALESQRDYTSLEVSFSGRERLWNVEAPS